METDLLSKMAEDYTGKRILITGAGGFLARNLLDILKEIDCTILRLSRKAKLDLPQDSVSRIRDFNGDIRERMIWEELLPQADVVFHFAAQTSIAVAEADRYADFNVNVLPLIHMLNVCRERDLSPVILFAGTVTSTGISRRLPVDEDHEDRPLTAYCRNKLIAEHYLKLYSRMGAVRGVTLRLPNLYGPGPQVSGADRGILNKMIQKAMEGKTLTIYGTGEPIRDYLFIDDAVSAFLTAGLFGERLSGNHYVIGSGEGYSLAETFYLVAERAARVTGHRVPVEYAQAPDGLPAIANRNFIADIRRFSEATGWKPQWSLVAGIDQTMDGIIRMSPLGTVPGSSS